jgi:hypothetical protein
MSSVRLANDGMRKTSIASSESEEQLSTKLRTLLQPRMNRDTLIACFDNYFKLEGSWITRATSEQRMLKKLTRTLTEDIGPLLVAGIRFNDDDAIAAFETVWTELIVKVKGDTWKLTDKAIEESRQKRYPKLLMKQAS